MSRLLLLLLIIQLALVLSKRRHQGMKRRLSSKSSRRTSGYSNRRQGRNENDGLSDYSDYSDLYEESDQYGPAEQYGAPVENGNPDQLAASVEGIAEASAVAADANILDETEAPAEVSKQVAGPTAREGLATGYTNYVDRCGDCQDVEEDPVCGSDGMTYPNSCQLENYACRKYWDIVMVSQVRQW